MKETITFDDVLIEPKFSFIESRKDVDLNYNCNGFNSINLPIISANMDTVTNEVMSRAMLLNGATSCLHRFQSIEQNVRMFKDSMVSVNGFLKFPVASIGLGKGELERAEALVSVGATSIIIDVANGASIQVVKQVKELEKLFGSKIFITVGNFGTAESVSNFLDHTGVAVEGIKIGIGPGSRCKTRIIAGIGYSQLSAILEISNVLKNTGITIIADGGLNSSGDCAKALGAGAHLLMSGSLFAGCEESPGEKVWKSISGDFVTEENVYPKKLNLDGSYTLMKECKIDLPVFKKYRGSASAESYEVQGKTASHRAAEGDSTYVPYKGNVRKVLQEIEGGLRSAFSYTNSKNLEEFHKNVTFVRVSNNTVIENGTRNNIK